MMAEDGEERGAAIRLALLPDNVGAEAPMVDAASLAAQHLLKRRAHLAEIVAKRRQPGFIGRAKLLRVAGGEFRHQQQVVFQWLPRAAEAWRVCKRDGCHRGNREFMHWSTRKTGMSDLLEVQGQS